jgi:hypothetical protein
MLEAYFLFLTLGPLAAFIIWEGIRNRRTSVKPLSRTSMESGFVPGAKNAERVCAIFAVTTAILGVLLIAQPQHPPFSGRGALLSSLLYSWFGVWGQSLFCWLLACVLVAVAVGARNKRLGARHAG